MSINLMQGDCLEKMKEIPDNSIKLIFTDPPYGIDYQSQWRKDKSAWLPKIKNDTKPFVNFISELKRLLTTDGCCLIFTRWDVQQQFIDEMKQNDFAIRNVLIWDKVVHGMGNLKQAYGSRYESIIFSSETQFQFKHGRPQDIIRVQRVSPNELLHPNEKPVQLLEELICQTTDEHDTILDCFMGSGSTGVAAVNTNRSFVGIELDEHYFNVAKERIEKAQELIEN